MPTMLQPIAPGRNWVCEQTGGTLDTVTFEL
jgi:hypothetical protein